MSDAVLTLAAIAVPVLVLLLAWLWLRPGRKPTVKPLPAVWALNPRPVFSNDERRVHRQLREAFPQHVILAKLPLVRFCQPIDPREVRKWFELLANIHVSFVVCTANGRVLAAIDVESKRGSSRRSTQILQSVLQAIKVRYLFCPAGALPSLPELRALVPDAPSNPGPDSTSPVMSAARDTLASTVASKRRERSNLWQESSFSHESFFAPDSRSGDLTPVRVAAGAVGGGAARPPRPIGSGSLRDLPVLTDEGGGMVIDTMPTMRH